MRKHPRFTRFLSLASGLALLFSCFGTALAAPPEELTGPDSPWDHYPSVDGLNTAQVYDYNPSGSWSFAQAPANTTGFVPMEDLYYVSNYAVWAVSSGIATSEGGVVWGNSHFRSDESVQLSGYMAAMVYTAPLSGTVRISAEAPITAQGFNGVRIAVYKSNQSGTIIPVWPVGDRWQYLANSEGAPGTEGNEYAFEPYDLCIQAGEKLYFVMDPDGNDQDDIVEWSPTVAYLNDTYDAADDPALALPEKAVMADVFPFADTADNNFEHGNGWRMDAARGSEYTPMNQNGWSGDWQLGRYYDYEGEIPGRDDYTVLWERGVITVYDSTNSWHCDAMYMTPAENGNDVAFTYQAPRDGVLSLNFGDAGFSQDTAGNVIGLAVYKNDVKIWPAEGSFLASSDTADLGQEAALDLEPVETAVRAGDLLHIRATRVAATGGECRLKVMPEAEYTSLEYDVSLDKEAQLSAVSEYSFVGQFSGTQGQDNWYYLYAGIGENETTEIPYYQDGVWCAGPEDYNVPQVYQGELLPGNMYDAVIAFKAPYTGKVTLYMDGGFWLQDSTGASDAGDGCYYGVQLSSDGEVRDILPLTYIPNGGGATFDPIPLDIQKNEYVYFRVNRGADHNWHDSLVFTPAVRYTEIDFDDPGIEEGPAAEREEPVPGSSLTPGRFPLTGRDYTDAAVYSLTAAELTGRIQAGNLEEGAVYEVTDHASLYFGGIGEETVYDLRNICIRTSPSGYSYDGPNPEQEGRFGIFLEANGAPVTLKNFTLEVSAWKDSGLSPEEAVNTWDCAGLTLENAEIRGTANHAVHSVNSREGAQTNLVNCRIEGAFSSGAVVFDDSSAVQAAAPSLASSCIINTAENAPAVMDAISSGALILNNALTADGPAVELRCSEAVVQNNELQGGVSLSAGLQNVLIALNEVAGGIAVPEGRNVVLLLNTADEITVQGGVSITLAENTVAGGIAAQGVDYLLAQDNKAENGIAADGSTNAYGDDLYDPAVRRENGVNEDLLPKTNVEVFAGMEYKSAVRTLDETLPLKRYLSLSARNQTYGIVPPGLYTADVLSLAGVTDYALYAYGVAVEFEEYSSTVFTMNNCRDVSIYGLYISHRLNANGQGTVIEKGDGYVIVQTDPGYLPDLTDTAYYPAATELYVEAFRPGEDTPFADIGFQSIAYLGGGKHRCVLKNDRGQELEVGGKIAVRGNGASVVVLQDCGNVRFEDFSIISGAGFGFQERNGDGGTQLYRVAITPKAAPVLAEDFDQSQYRSDLFWTDEQGRLRGPAPLISTCDATHSTNMRVGPQVVSCLFENMTDDGTNISGEFGKVLSYDPQTKALTYTAGDNYYTGLPANFRAGDTALLFTRAGELIACATVTAEPEAAGYQTYVLTLDRDVRLEDGTLIENLSANGAGFLFDNCLVDTTRSRGFLIKAPDGRITNCTIRNVGMAAVLVKPEVTDGWNECGYVQNLEITNNRFENTGFYSNKLISSPIAIESDGAASTDPAMLMHRDIRIQNNVVCDRNTDYALYIRGAQKVKVLDNDFGTRKGVQDDRSAAVWIDGAYDVEVSDNVYPENAQAKVELTSQTRNIYGTDIGQPPIGNYAAVSAATVYTADGWQVELTVENIAEETVTYTLAFADTTSAGLFADDLALPAVTLAAGEVRRLYFPVQTLPSDLSPRQSYAQVDILVRADNGAEGVFENQVTFNGAVKAPAEGEIDWTEIPGIGQEGTMGGERITADARFAWDDGYLYMRVEVTDDVQYDCENPDELWDWDSLQIGFSPNRVGYFVYSIGLIDGQVRIHVDDDQFGSLAGAWLMQEQMPSSIERNEEKKTTTYTMAVPWSLVGLEGNVPAGESYWFDIVVNDRDAAIGTPGEPGQWERNYLEYYGGIASGRQPAKFGEITLLDEPFVIPGADLSGLKEALEAAEAADTEGCTASSVAALEQAVEAAEALLKGELTVNDQEAVNAAAAALRQAVEGLKKAAEPGTEPDAKPSDENPTTGEPLGVRGLLPLVPLSALTAAAALFCRRSVRRRADGRR